VRLTFPYKAPVRLFLFVFLFVLAACATANALQADQLDGRRAAIDRPLALLEAPNRGEVTKLPAK
jgi:hypothetical protein